jgi:hemerythrin
MDLLQWKPHFSLGIPSVDQEHREMIRSVNQVYAGLEDEQDTAAVDAVLAEIHADISAHFALEERIMSDAGYLEYAAHKDNHEDLLDQIREMMDSFSDDPVKGKKILQHSLSDWFGQHFATFDARLHDELPR